MRNTAAMGWRDVVLAWRAFEFRDHPNKKGWDIFELGKVVLGGADRGRLGQPVEESAEFAPHLSAILAFLHPAKAAVTGASYIRIWSIRGTNSISPNKRSKAKHFDVMAAPSAQAAQPLQRRDFSTAPFYTASACRRPTARHDGNINIIGCHLAHQNLASSTTSPCDSDVPPVIALIGRDESRHIAGRGSVLFHDVHAVSHAAPDDWPRTSRPPSSWRLGPLTTHQSMKALQINLAEVTAKMYALRRGDRRWWPACVFPAGHADGPSLR